MSENDVFLLLGLAFGEERYKRLNLMFVFFARLYFAPKPILYAKRQGVRKGDPCIILCLTKILIPPD